MWWKEKEMLPYQEDWKLEKLLEELFSDDNELTGDGITVLNGSIGPFFSPSGNCCRYTYINYST